MKYRSSLSSLFLLLVFVQIANGQKTLSIKEALQITQDNFPTLKAKKYYVSSSEATLAQQRKEALPNFIISLQQDYGTVNGQNGPAYGLGGYGVASAGAPLASQNWHAGFGGLYIGNINWDFFTFGKVRERIGVAQSFLDRDKADLEQELFQQQVKVIAAYLNLLAAQRITRSQLSNLNRADTIKKVVTARANGGLIAGVDSSLSNAEVSNAKSALINATDLEQERANQLAFLMGIPSQGFMLDSSFLNQVPVSFIDTASVINPLTKLYQSRIAVSDQQLKYIKTLKYPTFSLFSVFQTRGSGFDYDYITDQSKYTKDYIKGIKPTRSNYLVGVGMTWNIISLARVRQQEKSQYFISKALTEEYNTISLQLKAQQSLADIKVQNAIANYVEAPVQVKAAGDAFLQKSVLYRNGLTTIIDVTQTLYALNRAETNRDIAFTNVWQALLLKAAANGDINLFLNQLK